MDISSYFGLYEKTFCPEQNTDLIHSVFFMETPAETAAEIFNSIYEQPEESDYIVPSWFYTCALGSTIICCDKIIILSPYPYAPGKNWFVFPGEAE